MNVLELLKKDLNLFIVENDNQSLKEVSVYQKNYDKDNVYFDMSIKCKTDIVNKKMRLYEVQRNKEFLIGQYADSEFGQLAFYIVVYSYFNQDKPSNSVRKMLRNIGEDVNKANKILEDHIGKNYFSLYRKEIGKINIDKINDDRCDVFYLSLENNIIPIVRNKRLPSAFVIIYNYGFYLKQFDSLMKKIISHYNLKLKKEETEELKRLYLKK